MLSFGFVGGDPSGAIYKGVVVMSPHWRESATRAVLQLVILPRPGLS